MAEPRLLILDEPSLGLSPLLVEEMFAMILRLNKEGLAVLLVEQNVMQSLDIVHRAYVLEHGSFVMSGHRRRYSFQRRSQTRFSWTIAMTSSNTLRSRLSEAANRRCRRHLRSAHGADRNAGGISFALYFRRGDRLYEAGAAGHRSCQCRRSYRYGLANPRPGRGQSHCRCRQRLRQCAECRAHREAA